MEACHFLAGETHYVYGHFSIVVLTFTKGQNMGDHDMKRTREDPETSEKHWKTNSIDWFKENLTGNPHISWENIWFPVDFPLSQPIEPWENRAFRVHPSYFWSFHEINHPAIGGTIILTPIWESVRTNGNKNMCSYEAHSVFHMGHFHIRRYGKNGKLSETGCIGIWEATPGSIVDVFIRWRHTTSLFCLFWVSSPHVCLYKLSTAIVCHCISSPQLLLISTT